MSKFGETKRRIVDLLKEKNMTLTEISERLNLAPSTVSQHIQELENAGVIKKSDEQHSRKWTYYELNKNQNIAIVSSGLGKMSISAAIVIAAILAITFYLSSAPSVARLVYLSPNGTISPGTTVFAISDAPTLYNITSLEVKISDIEVHSLTTGKWYSINVNKTFDLIELRNISEAMVGARLPNGTYNIAVLNVEGANATVNGNVENVFIPSKKLKLFEIFNVTNSSANLINFDFNLEDSLHVTGNGEVIMIPVIGVGYYQNRSAVLKNYMLPSQMFRHKVFFGMSENGTMLQNKMINYWIEIKNGKLVNAPPMPVAIIREPHKLSVIINAGEIPNMTNVTINGNNMSCVVKNDRLVVCISKRTVNPINITNEIGRDLGIINRSELSNRTIIANPNYEIARISTFYPNASKSMLYCNTPSDCSLIPLTFCQNNLPEQVACINSNYYSEYMLYYNEMKSHTPVMCPMFILAGRSSCACINNTCVSIYHGPVVMPMNTQK